MHAHRDYRRVDVPVAWMLEDIDLPCTLPLPEPRRLPDVAVARDHADARREEDKRIA